MLWLGSLAWVTPHNKHNFEGVCCSVECTDVKIVFFAARLM